MSKIGVCLGTRTCFVALPLSTDSVQIYQNLTNFLHFEIPGVGDRRDPSIVRLEGCLMEMIAEVIILELCWISLYAYFDNFTDFW